MRADRERAQVARGLYRAAALREELSGNPFQNQRWWRAKALNPRFDNSSRRRSERVLLQVRLLLETRLEDGTLVLMDAFTLVVNAHGGLLEVSQKLPRGHKFALVNTGTGLKASCQVLGVRKSSEDAFALAFEFEQPSPDFWPIHFPPRDWNLVSAK